MRFDRLPRLLCLRADVLNFGLDPAAERAAAGHAHGLNGRLRALFWRARRPPAPISSTTSPCDRARRSWHVVRATTRGGDRIMLDVLPQQRGSAGLAHGRGRGGGSRFLAVAWSRNPAGAGYWVMKVGPGAETRAGETSTPPFERTGRRVCEAAKLAGFRPRHRDEKERRQAYFRAAVRFLSCNKYY